MKTLILSLLLTGFLATSSDDLPRKYTTLSAVKLSVKSREATMRIAYLEAEIDKLKPKVEGSKIAESSDQTQAKHLTEIQAELSDKLARYSELERLAKAYHNAFVERKIFLGEVGKSYEQLTLSNGQVLREAKIQKIEEGTLTITDLSGIRTLDLGALPTGEYRLAVERPSLAYSQYYRDTEYFCELLPEQAAPQTKFRAKSYISRLRQYKERLIREASLE